MNSHVTFSFRLNEAKRKGSAINISPLDKTISVLLTDNISPILPGNTYTLQTPTDLERVTVQDHGVFAIAYNLKDPNDAEYVETTMKIASLCEIRNMTSIAVDEETLNCVTVDCVGRIQLLDRVFVRERMPMEKFHFCFARDAHDNLESCQLVAENIETFIMILTNELQSENHGHEALLDIYIKQLDRALLHDICVSDCSEEVKKLTATSWAAFNSISAWTNLIEIEEYIIRALDYENLFDRLKLAQYMLREIQLRIQGRRMLSNQNHCFDDDNAFQ
ncbi:predicted protein [Chaetoceros tenuissimus]|uniref:Uncharacterized protein n=1 Tax=Chaetoceros tenuissimus TaxID=426638 RepID=A0AAD3H6M1_9STRA|nr:predicted protein [Chaetoceros tenuissimus]